LSKFNLKDWHVLPDWYRRALVAELLEDWPAKNQEEKDLLIENDPDRVKAAGLWPGVEGDVALLKTLRGEC